MTGEKLAPGTVTGDKIDPATTPFSRVVDRSRGTASVPFAEGRVYPLDNPTYVQPNGEVDQYVGSFQVTFAPGCGGQRSASALLRIDPGQLNRDPEVVAEGIVEDEHAGEETRTVQFSATSLGSYGFSTAAPSSPKPHTFSVEMLGSFCSTGSAVTLDGAEVDVIGTR